MNSAPIVSNKWDARLYSVAGYVSEWSKDQSTKVGAVIAKGKHIVSTGFNGFPPGVDDNVISRHERPLKYFYTEHAERNAIFVAHKHGASVDGCTIYVPYYPCADCARAIIAVGIKRVVTGSSVLPGFKARWAESIAASEEMFEEAGVKVRFISEYTPGEIPEDEA